MISPIVYVVKHGAKTRSMQVRIVCNFRYLNKFMQFDPFPIAEKDEVINTLAAFSILSIFDAKAGFWQTPVQQHLQWLLGFATHHGLWQWTRTPFGAKNSGSTFSRAPQHVLKPVRYLTANYVDDMGIDYHTWNSYLVNLRRYFHEIRSAGITLKLPKCEFGKPLIKFVGHIVGSSLKSADQAKLEAIKLIPIPTHQKQLSRF